MRVRVIWWEWKVEREKLNNHKLHGSVNSVYKKDMCVRVRVRVCDKWWSYHNHAIWVAWDGIVQIHVYVTVTLSIPFKSNISSNKKYKIMKCARKEAAHFKNVFQTWREQQLGVETKNKSPEKNRTRTHTNTCWLTSWLAHLDSFSARTHTFTEGSNERNR